MTDRGSLRVYENFDETHFYVAVLSFETLVELFPKFSRSLSIS